MLCEKVTAGGFLASRGFETSFSNLYSLMGLHPAPQRVTLPTTHSLSLLYTPTLSPFPYPTHMHLRRGSVARPGAVRAAADEEVEEELMMIEESAVSGAESAVSGAESAVSAALGAMERMEKTLDSVRGNFNTVRTGRASPSLLDRIEVEYYGASVILKSIAQIAAPDGSMLLVTPFDKSSIPSIEKAIMKSDVGLTPSSDGNVIRLSIPQLTAERRKELLKTVSKLSEDGKVALRNVRRDSIKAYEKLQKVPPAWTTAFGIALDNHFFLESPACSTPLNAPSFTHTVTKMPAACLRFCCMRCMPHEKKISEDALKDLSNDIQKMTDDYVKQIDTAFKQKEKDLLTV
ncbi:unnamed protein product [Closterium sp. NIES-65]|nr:unnamed protein product [Closterium sp. NIES-65]